MAFTLEHFPNFPYPPSGMQEVEEVERYLTSLYRSMQEHFSTVPRDIKDGIGSVELDDLANTTLSDPGADRIVFWDDGAGVYTWLKANTGLAISTTNLNLSHLGLESLADPDADRIFFWDNSVNASKWLTATEGTQISGTDLKANIGGLAADATPDATADYVMTLDATDSTHKKALINTLTAIDTKVAIDSSATAGYLGAAANDGVLRTGAPLTYADGGNYITLDWAHLGFESLADPGADRIAFWDNSESAFKWLACDGTTIGITATTLAVIAGGVDHGSLSGLDDADHNAVYYTETEIDLWRNGVSQTEMGYLDGVTSDIQTQLDARCLESVLGTSIGAGLILDSTTLKVDVELQAIAGLTSAANRYIRFTGSGSADLRTYANVLADIGAEAADATIVKDADFGSAGLCATDGAGAYSIVTDASANWNTAYGWGDHASGGYAAASHAMATHSDEDTYNISTSGTLGAGNATLGTVNDLTLASAATGFTIAGGSTSKTLTVNDIFNVSTQLAAIGANTAKVTCNFTNVQTALAAASGAVDFNQQHLTGVYNIIGVSSGVPEFKHSIDDGAIYISGGSAYDHGGSLQFYGEDQASYPGDVYIVSGSHDATPASVIQLAYRSAGSYQTIMTLGNDRHIDIWDWDDSAMREVSFGADDSGGAGYKVLRIPN